MSQPPLKLLCICPDASLMAAIMQGLPMTVALSRAPTERVAALVAALNQGDWDALLVACGTEPPPQELWRLLSAAAVPVIALVEPGMTLAPPVNARLSVALADLHRLPGLIAPRPGQLLGGIPCAASAVVSQLPKASNSEDEVLDRAVNLLAASLGDIGGAMLLDDDDGIAHLAIRHEDPTGQQLTEALWSRPDWRTSRGNGLYYTASTGQPLLATNIDAAFWRQLPLTPMQQGLLTRLGIKGALAVPIRSSGGIKGALAVLTTSDERPLTAETQGILAEIAGQTAEILDRVQERRQWLQHLQAAAQTAERNERMLRLSAELSGIRGTREAGECMVKYFAEIPGSASIALWEAVPGEDVLSMVAILSRNAPETSPEISIWHRCPLSHANAITEASQRQTTCLYRDRARLAAAYPDLVDALPDWQQAWAAIPLIVGADVLGVIGLSFAQPMPFAAEDVAHWEAMALQCTQAFERARLYDSLQGALDKATREQHRQSLLAKASSILATPLDPVQISQDLTDLCVPELADGCMVSLIDPCDGLMLVAARHISADCLAEFDRRYRHLLPKLDGPTYDQVFRALEGGPSYQIGGVTDPPFDTLHAAHPEMLALFTALGYGAALILPLRARGRAIGLMSVGHGNGKDSLSAGERRFWEDLASRAALALDAARLVLGLEMADESKDVFLATLAHELRNPLGAISLAAGLIALQRPEDETATIIRRQTAHLTHLLNDLLDLSRITRGKISLQMEAIDIGALVGEIVGDLANAVVREHPLTVAGPAAAVWVNADRVRLAQVITNLLDNAAKFSPAQSPIRLDVDSAEDWVVIAIHDSGNGLAKEEQQRIFEPFAQLGDERQGLGLGLALVKELIRLHRGRIAVASDGKGKGCTFTVHLPKGGPATFVPDRRIAGTAGGHRWRVLVVEDNEDARHGLQAMLTAWGHEVTSTASAKAGLALADQLRPDVVILDIALPDGNGLDLARALRARLGKTPLLVAISGFGQPQDVANGQQAGFNDYLTKPVDLDHLRTLLATHRAPRPGER